MALNFPSPATNGQTWTDPTGRQWVYDTGNNSWTAKGGASGGMVYKGGIDVTTAPPAGVQSGWLYVVTTSGTLNAGFTGLTGTIPVGSQIVFGGPNWQVLSSPGPWGRAGTELSPSNAGDSVFTSGAVKVGGTTAAPNITLKADGGASLVGDVTVGAVSSSTVGGIQLLKSGILSAFRASTTALDTVLQIQSLHGGTKKSVFEVAASGETRIGGDINTAPNIRLTDTGKGFFKEDVSIGGTLPASPNITLASNGNITYAGTLTPPSDATLKEAIVDADLDNQWDDIKRIQLRNYRWKGEPERGTMLGVIAQELETISPGLIVKDLDDDGNVVEGSCKVKVDALYMKMLGALQVAQQRIEALETRLAALEPAAPHKQADPGAK